MDKGAKEGRRGVRQRARVIRRRFLAGTSYASLIRQFGRHVVTRAIRAGLR